MTTRRDFIRSTLGTSVAVAAASSVTNDASAAAEKNNKACSRESAMKDVRGKVAFITGGSSGIGLGIARAFFDAGMKVVITYRTQKHVDEAMQYFKSDVNRVHAISVDVTDRPGMQRAAEESVRRFGTVHALVNNAGIFLRPTLAETSFDDWDWTMNVNCTGVFNGIRAFLPIIKANADGGHIVSTSSVMGLYAMGSFAAAYTASKFAVVGMMEALRVELADTKVGVSVFCPGVVNSNIGTADRNRPHEPASTSDKENPKPRESGQKVTNNEDISMDPQDVGRLVLEGVRNNDLYILTHPEYRRILAERHAAMMASFTDDSKLPPGRRAILESAKQSIYSKQQC